MTGSLSVLNVGAGDIEMRFNQHNIDEREKAIRMLKDMQARGYAILVRLDDGSYVRALEIDADRGCYIVQMPTDAPALDASEPPVKTGTCACGCGRAVTPVKTWVRGHYNRRKGKRGRRVAVPVHRAHATGVARSAGG